VGEYSRSSVAVVHSHRNLEEHRDPVVLAMGSAVSRIDRGSVADYCMDLET